MELQLDWQQPNNTEGTAWQRLSLEAPQALASYVAYPWASWIDAVQRELLPPLPPLHHPGRALRVSVCQHIAALDHLEVFAAAGITDLFWPHTTRRRQRAGGLRLHPFPLFPVRCHDLPPPAPGLPAAQRPLLYSYLGFHEPGLYAQDTRLWLLSLPPRPDALVQGRGEWHFEQQVYRQQVHGQPPDRARLAGLEQEARQYVEALQDSCFALCPSGAGPSSIRLWEALGFGAIPVILSDALQLPGPEALWRQAALFVAEQEREVAALPALLEELRMRPALLTRMQRAGRQLWQRYGLPCFVADVAAFLEDPDAALLEAARRRLRALANRVGVDGAMGQPDLLEQDDPARLALQVQRWCRGSVRGRTLVIRLIDRAPLDEQQLRWRAAVCVSRALLEASGVAAWTVASRSPVVEGLAESGQEGAA